MVNLRTETELKSLVNKEANVETIKSNSNNIRDLPVPFVIAFVLTPKPLSAQSPSSRKRIIFDDDENWDALVTKLTSTLQ